MVLWYPISCQNKKDKSTRRVISNMSLSYLLADDHTTMLNIIEKILCHFESCFSRKAAFRWFVIIITGLMLRSDKLGVTSILRDLALAPGCYDSMLHFFRASSWSLEDIRKTLVLCCQTVCAPLQGRELPCPCW